MREAGEYQARTGYSTRPLLRAVGRALQAAVRVCAGGQGPAGGGRWKGGLPGGGDPESQG